LTGHDNPFYPLKAVSRCLPVVRTNKLRVSWFALGLLAGIGGTLAMTTGMPFAPSAPPEITADITPAPAEMSPVQIAETPAQPAAEPLAAIVTKDDTQPAAQAMYPLTQTLTIESGDTLMDMLTDTGVAYDDANNLIRAIGKAFNVKRLSVGQTLTVELDKNANADTPFIKSVVLPVSQTATLEIARNEKNNFEVKKVFEPTERKVNRAQASIEGSFYETGAKQGLPPAMLAELIKAFSYDIDFQRDVQRGDKLDVLYERMQTKEGIAAGYGNVLYASLDLGQRTIKIYRYADKKGNADYYDAKGASIRKALLRTPINGAKITSRFGFRTHPILGYSKMHRGVDFGAPTGTPVYAAGDGVVGFASRKGGYGNYLMIKHSGTYGTAYGHLSRFARGVAPGKKVKQGQIVAYVGTTGMSTGPHLHYEVLVKNQQVNPSGVKFKTGNVLAGKELAAFRTILEQVQAQLSSNEKLAMTAPEKKPEMR
jgi:murein DD-endopeptidase MepM/ murein hydrolase activator NlpD